MKCTVDNVQYKSKPNNGKGCDGCAGFGDDLCHSLDPCLDIIWVKVKPRMKVDGVTYKVVKERTKGSCGGCVTNIDSDLCRTLCPHNECYEQGIIWVEKKPKPVDVAPTKTVRWANIYRGTALHLSKEDADAQAGTGRLACVQVEY